VKTAANRTNVSMASSQSGPLMPETATAPERGIAVTLPFLALAPIALFVPSGSAGTDRAKLALLSALTATFLLFATKTWFPGGATQFIRYADAIVHGTTLPPDVAARDAGYPLLIILSGYLSSHSLIPLLLIQAGFAILLPIVVYESLRRLAPIPAYYVGLASIITLSPFYFMKLIHHDQLYIFSAELTLCLLLIFVQTKQPRFLYVFTIAAICASVARPAGNALFPLFLVAGYLAARGSILHYLACSVVFAAFVAGYAWHREVIFDMQHSPATPSYLGRQIFYDPYLNTLDYGIRLSPHDVGPNFTRALDALRNRLQPSPRDSEFVETQYGRTDYKGEFASAYIDPLTTDELMDQVLARPNWEYYTLLCLANDDRLLLAAALEIARAHPSLILRYSVRNFLHFTFDPGYKHSRYNLNPFRSEALLFYPAQGAVDENVTGFPARAMRELNFDPVPHEPFVVHRLFNAMQTVWLKSYRTEVAIMALLMCVAWGTAAVRLVQAVRPRTKSASMTAPNSGGLRKSDNALVASIVIASLVFGYNAAVTAIFAEPDFRYRQASDLQAILIAGLGLIAMQPWIGPALRHRVPADVVERWNRAVRWIHAGDVWPRLTAMQLAAIVIGTACAGLAGWTLFILANTQV
jgi:hypothetical protein